MASSATIFDTDCVLMLHADGADASTLFSDSSVSNKTVTANGNAQIDTAQSVFGGASCLLDGSGDFLSFADSSDWALGSTWTIDFWVRFAAAGGRLFGQFVGAGNYAFCSNEGGALSLNINGTVYANGTFNPTLNQWYHIALADNAGTLKIFIDGTQNGSQGSVPSWGDYASAFTIGDIAGVPHNGWIDEFRVVKGTAVWTASFTPPSAAYTPPLSGNFFLMF